MGSDDDPVAIALERAAKRAARIADLNGAGQELLGCRSGGQAQTTQNPLNENPLNLEPLIKGKTL